MKIENQVQAEIDTQLYHIGDTFELRGSILLLAQVAPRDYAFIDLGTGNRYFPIVHWEDNSLHNTKEGETLQAIKDNLLQNTVGSIASIAPVDAKVVIQ